MRLILEDETNSPSGLLPAQELADKLAKQLGQPLTQVDPEGPATVEGATFRSSRWKKIS